MVHVEIKVEMERVEISSPLTPMVETMLNMMPTMTDHHLLTMKVKGIEVSKVNDTPATWYTVFLQSDATLE